MNKTGKLFKPINIFKFLVAGSVIGISSFNLFILDKFSTVTVTTNRLFLVSQLLLIVMFIVNGIEGLKDENKAKRSLSYVYFITVIIMLVLDTLTILTLSRSHSL